MNHLLIVSTIRHPIKAYNMDAILEYQAKDPKGFEKFDKKWGHSLNIISALDDGSTVEFQEIA